MAKSTRFPTAVHILTMLTIARGEYLSSEFLSQSIDANPAAIRRILGMLGGAGWISSQHGAHGGTRLAVKPEKISLLDIYRLVEEENVFRMHQPNLRCPVAQSVKTELESALTAAERAMRDVLAKRSLAEVAKKPIAAYDQWQKEKTAC